jgi:hypothetical protein
MRISYGCLVNFHHLLALGEPVELHHNIVRVGDPISGIEGSCQAQHPDWAQFTNTHWHEIHPSGSGLIRLVSTRATISHLAGSPFRA